MKNKNMEQEVDHKDNATSSALAGLLIGGLAGAGAALLLAPQSGKETRDQIQQKTVELRDRTAETVKDAVSQVKSKTEDTVSQVKSKTGQIASSVHDKAEELQHQGQEIIAKQLDHVSAAAEAGKAALTSETPEPEKRTYKNY